MNNEYEDSVLETHIHSKALLTIFITNGIQLKGVIVASDSVSLGLSRDGVTQLVYKNSIATIMPPVE